MAEEAVSVAALAEERLKLEREAFEIERNRLESARARAEAELKAARAGHPFLVYASVALLALASFSGGMLLGVSVNEGRHQRQREARLRDALSQLGGLTDVADAAATTNAVSVRSGQKIMQGRSVSVVVLQ